jgi:hypothetical protein
VDGKESNNGFIEMHTPMGLLLLVFFFLMLVAFIGAGAAFFKLGLARDREAREELKRQNKPPSP